MKAIVALLASFGLIGYLVIIAWFLFALTMAAYGLYLAFSASIILGIIVLVVQPSPLVIGLVMLFFHKNLAQMLVDFLSK